MVAVSEACGRECRTNPTRGLRTPAIVRLVVVDVALVVLPRGRESVKEEDDAERKKRRGHATRNAHFGDRLKDAHTEEIKVGEPLKGI